MVFSGKPRICFLVGGREGGGSALSMLQLIQGVDRERYDVTIAACEDGEYSAQLRQAGLQCHILGTGWPPLLRHLKGTSTSRNLHGYARLIPWTVSTALALARYVRSDSISVIHTNYHHFHLVGGLVCVGTRRKCVWHWRAPVRNTMSSGSRDLRSVALRGVVRCLAGLAGKRLWSIANSRATAQSIRPLVGDRCTVIYNGIRMGPPPAERVRLRSLLGLPEQARIVGLVGTMNPIKGHIYFIEAAARICRRYDDVHFVHIGGQTAAKQKTYEESLLARRTELGLDGRLHFLGHRPDAPQLTADFDIATVCTLPPGEGFGMVLIEAMAQAVPVISTDEGAATEIVTNGTTGILVPAADVDALASAIDGLLRDEKRRRAIGQAGREHCRLRFDIGRTVEEVQRIYDSVLSTVT